MVKLLSSLSFFIILFAQVAFANVSDYEGDSLKVLASIKLVKKVGGRSTKVGYGKEIKILPDNGQPDEFVRVQYSGKVYFIDRQLLSGYLKRKRRPVFKISKRKRASRAKSRKRKGPVDTYKGRPPSVLIDAFDYKVAKRRIAKVINQNLVLSRKLIVGTKDDKLFTLRKGAKFKILPPAGRKFERSHYYIESDGKTFYIPKRQLQEFLNEGVPVYEADLSSKRYTRTVKSITDPCEKIGKGTKTVRRKIQVEAIEGNPSTQEWETQPFKVVSKSRYGIKGPYCVLVPIDKLTGKPIASRAFRTYSRNLVGVDGSKNIESWELSEVSLPKAKRKEEHKERVDRVREIVDYTSDKRDRPEACATPQLFSTIDSLDYETCKKSNNYLEGSLRSLVSNEDLKSTSPMKACIHAGLNIAKNTHFKFAQCNSKDRQINTSNPRKRPCFSNNYLSYVHKEMKNVASCFENVSLEELIPLTFSESKFGINSYNVNRSGTLNASGLMGLTQSVIEDYEAATYLKQDDVKDTPKCKKLLKEFDDGHLDSNIAYKRRLKGYKSQLRLYRKGKAKHPGSKPKAYKRNVCKRTSIPDGVRKSLMYTIKKYNYFKNSSHKQSAKSLIKMFGKSRFKSKDLKLIQTDLARMIHSRGNGMVRSVLAQFKHDLLKGDKGKLKTKGVRSNPKIHKLWGSPSLGTKMSREQFKKYFSSYVYHAKGTKTRKEWEGGIYLHKADCNQLLLEQQAEKLYGKDVRCGQTKLGPKISSLYKKAIEKKNCEYKYLKNLAAKPLESYYSVGKRKVKRKTRRRRR